MKLHFFLSTNNGTIFIFVIQKSNDIKSQAEESVMLRFNPDIYFLDIRVKPEYDRKEVENDNRKRKPYNQKHNNIQPHIQNL